MNISEEIDKLKKQRQDLVIAKDKIHGQILEINQKLRSIGCADRARIKKLSKILGEGQKGVAE